MSGFKQSPIFNQRPLDTQAWPKAELCALDSTTPWADFSNPRPVQEGTDGSLDSGAQRDQQATYDSRVSIYISQSNVKRAIIIALNKSVPKKYKLVDGGIGAMTNRVNQCPRTILGHLRNLYGRPIPNKKNSQRDNVGSPIQSKFPHRRSF